MHSLCDKLLVFLSQTIVVSQIACFAKLAVLYQEDSALNIADLKRGIFIYTISMTATKNTTSPKTTTKKSGAKDNTKAKPKAPLRGTEASNVVSQEVANGTESGIVTTESGIVTNELESQDQAPSVAAVPTTFADLNNQYLEIVRRIEKDLREIRTLGKRLQQAHTKEVKQLQSAIKSGGRRKRNNVNNPNASERKPKGIAWPGPLSSELAAFLKVEPDTQLARTQVIKRLAEYIRTQNLQNPQDKRLIVPDKALQQLLRFPENFNEPISYFNLQRLLKHHFPGNTAATTRPRVEA